MPFLTTSVFLRSELAEARPCQNRVKRADVKTGSVDPSVPVTKHCERASEAVRADQSPLHQARLTGTSPAPSFRRLALTPAAPSHHRFEATDEHDLDLAVHAAITSCTAAPLPVEPDERSATNEERASTSLQPHEDPLPSTALVRPARRTAASCSIRRCSTPPLAAAASAHYGNSAGFGALPSVNPTFAARLHCRLARDAARDPRRSAHGQSRANRRRKGGSLSALVCGGLALWHGQRGTRIQYINTALQQRQLRAI